MSPTPPLLARPRRFASPFPASFAKLEPIQQPLYSAFLFDAATVPSTAQFFNYGIGGTVSTNAAAATIATYLHTNLTATSGGGLPSPKIYLVQGLRIVPAELSSALIDVIDDTAAASSVALTFVGQDSDLLEDLLRLVYGSVITFAVGAKEAYLRGPTFLAPANSGVVGVSDSTLQLGATPSALSERQSIRTFHSAGRYMALNQYPILIPSQQNWSVALDFPQSTRPTMGASRAVWAVLDGILGREVQ